MAHAPSRSRPARPPRLPAARRALGAATALLLVLLALPAARAQDVSVEASVNARTVGTQDFVIYTIAIEADDLPGVETPSVPLTQNLALTSPYPTTERQVSVAGTQMQQRLAFRWTFRPVGTGTARIGAARVRAGTQIYQTDPVEIEVVGQGSRVAPSGSARRSGNRRGQPDRPATLTREQAFIRATASQRSAYVGEQVVVTYRLFFDPRVQFRQIRLADSWDAAGFWREDLDVESSPIPRREVVDGVAYSVIDLKRVSLFATRAGALEVEPFTVATEAVVPPPRSSDPLARLWSLRGEAVEARISSNALRIDVRPLPARPDGFSGAVGQFRMSTSLDRAALETGQSARLTVQIAGDGNLATLDPPTVDAPGTVEVYPPETDLDPTRSGSRLRARAVYRYALVPRVNGTIAVPPVAFTYFDPDARAYRTLRGDGATLVVTGEPISARTSALPPDALAPIAAVATLTRAPDRTPLHRQAWPYALTALPLVLLAAALVAGRRRAADAADPDARRSRTARAAARRALRDADAALAAGDAPAFYARLEDALLGFVGGRLRLNERALTRPDLDAHLARAGVASDVRRAVATLLARCDQARFAPSGPPAATRAGDRDTAAALLTQLHQALPTG